MNIAQSIVACLEKYGVKHLYGIPGDSINYMMDALRTNKNVDFIHVAHEEGGAFAASGQSKSGAQLSACMGTSGPGAIHLLNGLYDAQKDGAPVLCITGQVESSTIGLKAHQEVNLEKLFDDVCCYQATIWNAENAISIIDRACREAIANKGISHISIPGDIAPQSAKDEDVLDVPIFSNAFPYISKHEINQAQALIKNSKKPLVLAGMGCLHSKTEFETFVQNIHAPVIKTLKAKALLPDEHPNCFGGLGLLGIPPAVKLMHECDLLIMLGTDYPYMEFLNRDVKTIQVDIEAGALGRRKPIDLAIHATCESFLCEMNNASWDQDDDFLASNQKYMKLFLYLMDQVDQNFGEQIKPQNMMRLIGDLASKDAIFCCDTGSVTSFFAKSLRMRDEQEVYFSGNLASMAFSLSASLGVQLQHPDRQVIAVSGDGSINMLAGELGTIKRYNLPIKIFILNNQRLHLIDFEENVKGLPQYGTELQNPDYSLLGQAYGIKAKKVTDPQTLRSDIETCLASKEAYILDVHVNPKQMLYPPKVEIEQAFGFTVSKVKELWNQITN